MIQLTPEQILDLVPEAETSRLHTLVNASLPPVEVSANLPRWTADFFGLDRVSVFRDAREETQQEILHRLSAGLLDEALFIEQSGMAFATRMALLADTHEKRMLYCLIAGEEATHYHWVRSALGEHAASARPGPFHQLLAEIVATAPNETMVYMVQVLLEGWGLEHYRRLQRGCSDSNFKATLDQILLDESRHHGSGVVMCREGRMGERDRPAMLELLHTFFQIVRVGPISVVSTLEQVLGGLTDHQHRTVYAELDAEIATQRQLYQLRRLLDQDGFADVVATLEQQNVFVPYPAEMCR